jgi:cysteine-rich secretory family protein
VSRARLALTLSLAALGLWLLGSDRAWAQASEEGCFTASANAARAQEGIPAFDTKGELVDLARRHSGEMAASGTIFHNQSLGSDVPGKWTLVGENVGQGGTCESIHRAFMNSPGHRKNIMEPRYNYVGMGVVLSNGTVFITEVFMEMKTAAAAPKPAAPAAPAPAPVVPKPPPSPKPPAAPKAPPAPASPTVKAAPPVPAPATSAPAAPVPPAAGPASAAPSAAGPTGDPSPGGSESSGGAAMAAVITGTALLLGGGFAFWHFVMRRRK